MIDCYGSAGSAGFLFVSAFFLVCTSEIPSPTKLLKRQVEGSLPCYDQVAKWSEGDGSIRRTIPGLFLPGIMDVDWMPI